MIEPLFGIVLVAMSALAMLAMAIIVCVAIWIYHHAAKQ